MPARRAPEGLLVPDGADGLVGEVDVGEVDVEEMLDVDVELPTASGVVARASVRVAGGAVDAADVGLGVGVAAPEVLVGWVLVDEPDVDLLVTGVSGSRAPAADECAAEARAAPVPVGSRPGTVTWARVPLGAMAVRVGPGAVAAVSELADRPVPLPQAASNSTVMP